MLQFCNQYPQTIQVAIMWYNPNCPDGSNWEKRGWWTLAPGSCANVLDRDVGAINRYIFYYAETVGAATTWAGPYYSHVPDEAFDWCSNLSSTSSRYVGFRQVDVGSSYDYTVTLTS